jgi:hypothetical protein
MAAAALENKTGFRAVDAHLFHFRIRQMLSKRSKWCDRSEDAAPELLRLFVIWRRQGRALFLADYSPNELVDPTLIVHSQSRAVAPSELRCELGFDERSYTGFGGRRCGRRYDHVDLMSFLYRPEAMAIASSGLDIGVSLAYAAPGSATTAARCMVAAA